MWNDIPRTAHGCHIPEWGLSPIAFRSHPAILRLSMSTKPHPVENHFNAVALIMSSGAGVPATSYYPMLSALLNETGGKLTKPRVVTVINPANHVARIL